MPFDHNELKTPGQLIRLLIQERGWSQRFLATVAGVSLNVINRVLRDEKPVDATLALTLSEVFGIAPEQFLALQQKYDLAHARIVALPDRTRIARAKLFSELPIAEMIRRGWIAVDNAHDIPTIENALARFFNVASINDIDMHPHAAKKTNAGTELNAAQLAWLHRVRQIAEGMIIPHYSSKAMLDAMRQLKSLLASAEEARKAPRILAEAGVRLVVVESVPGARIDGVCFWLDDFNPVIGLTMRYDRLDNFWFVLRHECEHVIRGDGRAGVTVDVELEKGLAGVGPDVEVQERAANEAAADFCVPQKALRQFVARKDPIFTERDIVAFSRMLRVHPGLVAGQLQHITARYERFRNHLTKVRGIVLPNVIHDGWGDQPPVELISRGS